MAGEVDVAELRALGLRFVVTGGEVLSPQNREHIAKVLGHLEPETRRRVLQDNAAELYRIPLP